MVKVDAPETKTSAGIIVSKPKPDSFLTGTVAAIGPIPYNSKGKQIPLEYKEGDRIIFPNGVHTELSGYYVLTQHEPVAVIGEDTVIGGLG